MAKEKDEKLEEIRPKVVRVNDYLNTDNGFAHDVVRRTAKETEAILKANAKASKKDKLGN